MYWPYGKKLGGYVCLKTGTDCGVTAIEFGTGGAGFVVDWTKEFPVYNTI